MQNLQDGLLRRRSMACHYCFFQPTFISIKLDVQRRIVCPEEEIFPPNLAVPGYAREVPKNQEELENFCVSKLKSLLTLTKI